MFTDEKGYARSIPLPYGTYVVRETTSKHNYAPVDDFVVKITENHPDTPQTWRVLLDKEFKAKLRSSKRMQKHRNLYSWRILNSRYMTWIIRNMWNRQHPIRSQRYTKSYFTNEEGYLVLPRKSENLVTTGLRK